METKSIIIVGVGGQGTLLASRIMGRVFLKKGYDVKVSEVHGMSQRGGSVVTYVRYGSCVASAVVDKGEADMIISFEKLESARWLSYLKKGGVLISNDQEIDPMPVIAGAAVYPSDVLDRISGLGVKTVTVSASKLAEEAGSAKAANTVLLGVASVFTDIPAEEWLSAIAETVPARTVQVNTDAFLKGRAAVEIG